MKTPAISAGAFSLTVSSLLSGIFKTDDWANYFFAGFHAGAHGFCTDR
jgi:hypothetical protein